MNRSMPLEDCKTANLKNAAFIQGDGALIALDAHSLQAVACSRNISDWLGLHAEDALGQTGAQLFGPLWPQLELLAQLEGHHQIADLTLPGQSQACHIIAHRCVDRLIYEIRAFSGKPPLWWGHAARMAYMDRLSTTTTLEECVGLLVDEVARHTGLDRVMAYKFLPDWHGEVIYEACRPGIGGFLGLRFPASDLPVNARQLYTLNWHRVIADLEQNEIPLCFAPDEPALDLTYSVLRAVHPVHIQYLRNMQVRASLSLSLVANGSLWGLVTCHHMQSLTLGIHERFALEEMARLTAMHLKNLLQLADLAWQNTLREQLAIMRDTLGASTENPGDSLISVLPRLRKLFRADSVWLHFQGNDHFCGMADAQTLALVPLRDWIDRLPLDNVSHYAHLPERLQNHSSLVRHASGLLHIPLGMRDHLVLLRQEAAHVVHWAGKPTEDSPAQPLTPRNSFDTWSEQVRYTAEPWHGTEILHARNLHKELGDYINLSRLERMALNDPLSGLANRLQFNKRLQQQCSFTSANGLPFAVHMIDLDRFKATNDTLGHIAGDELLQAVAHRLQQIVRSQDTVARLGGDEFAIIQPDLASAEEATALARRIVTEIAKPYTIRNMEVHTTTSVGVALFPAHTTDKEELLHLADIALYDVKKMGRNNFALYSPALQALHANRERRHW